MRLSNWFGKSASRGKTPPPVVGDDGIIRPPEDWKFKVHPLVNMYMRLTGEWPLSGPPELTEEQYARLFTSTPAFVDYFPIIDYDDQEEVFLLDDGINVAKIWRVNTRYMGARSDRALQNFNMELTRALNALPVIDDSNPYIVQVFAQTEERNTIVRDLERAMAEHGLQEDPYSQAILEVNRQHADLVSHPKGIFPDSRIAGASQGWRVGAQAVYLCIYRRADEKFWKRNKRAPAEQLRYDLTSFDTSLANAGISIDPLQPHELVSWLAPYFGHEGCSKEDMDSYRETANFDLGQRIFHHQPSYHFTNEERERGIWRFGDAWLRYLTIGGIERVPRDGVITLGEQNTKGNDANLGASLFEQLPVGSMMSWTIVPQSDHMMKMEVDKILYQSQDTASRQAKYAEDQANEVHEEMMRNKHKVFYVQMGVFLKNASLSDLLDSTEVTMAKIKTSGCIEVINPKFDLISQDSFIRALPTVYSFAHDRNAALRARKCYTAHLAAMLPFYGNKSGGKNPCYIMFTRTGEPFYLNPFHEGDREKVSHELFFGPSGSGKSASICYMSMQSMAVNNPRMFLFDYGNSFKLLADYMERHGKKVKRFVLSANSEDVLAPFFETDKALEQAAMAQAISDGTWTPSTKDDGEDDENREYLAEMEYILRIMITGGRNIELKQSQIARIQRALIRGLQKSKDKNEPHARPIHMAEAMEEMAKEEMQSEHGQPEIALDMREMADAIRVWTTGTRGLLFNRHAKGFSPDYDLTVVELGALGKEGSEDMLAVAGLSAINTITALAEKLQGSGRAIEVKIDEAHLWAKIPLLMSGMVVAVKVFRKLGCWLCIITQDITYFKGDAKKILGNAEFWWLMKMDAKEIAQAETILNLSDEVKHLIRYPRKEERRYVEGISMSSKYPDTLIRFVPPSLMLALGQTDSKEKEQRYRIMEEQGVSELDAALIIAEQIETARRQYQKEKAA